MATLYRKYRPQNFKEVVGQNHIKVTLQNEVQTGKIAHAYLFCGPRAVGKTTLARVLTKTLNCTKRKDKEFEPCNKCALCEEITSGRNLDIMEMDAASHTGVDNVRENVISFARVAPSRCKYKVFIIDEVHMLSISAFNALLKIIEEPPEFVVFILCTTEVHKVPTTIISRCQRFDFKRISVSDSVAKLNYIIKKEGIKIDKSILESIARHSEGYQRDAEGILGQIVAVGGKEITQEDADLVIPRSDLGEIINLIELVAKKDSARGITLINRLLDEGVDLRRLAEDLVEVLRKIMLEKINPGLAGRLNLEAGEALEIKINEVSARLSLEEVIEFIDKFIEVKNSLKTSFIIQLPFELAITELGLRVKPEPGEAKKTGQAPIASQASPTAPRAKPVNPASANAANINIDNVKAQWPEILSRVKKYNHSLSFILRVCRPLGIEDNSLKLAFKYKFHKDRISDPGIKEIVENVIKEVCGFDLKIEPGVDENLEINSSELVDNNAKVSVGPEKDQPAAVEAGSQTTRQNSLQEGGQAGQGNMMDNLLKTFEGKIVK